MTQAEASMRAARLGMAEEVRRERLPDIGVGLGLMQMGDRAEGWELMFEVEIPLQQGARRQRERAADLRAEAAGAREQAVADELRGRVGAAYAMWQSAGEQEGLVSGQLLPQAQAGLESALAGYQVGAVDFDTLLQALTLTLNAERDRLDARRDRLQAAVELKLLQGKLP
jgi:outer membrane protein TolC